MQWTEEEKRALKWRSRIFSYFVTYAGFRLLIASYALSTLWQAGIDYFSPRPADYQPIPETCNVPNSSLETELRDRLYFNLEVFAVSTVGLWLIGFIAQKLWLYYTAKNKKDSNTLETEEEQLTKQINK